MRRDVLAKGRPARALGCGELVSEALQFAGQGSDAFLLRGHQLIQGLEQVFTEAEFFFQARQALLDDRIAGGCGLL